MNKSYKEMRESQNEVRIQLTNYIAHNLLFQSDLAREMHIAPATLLKFLTHGKDVSFITLARIIEFLNIVKV